MSSDSADLWERLCFMMRFHRQRASCEDKINGIWRKSPFLKAIQALPRIGRTNVDLTRETWELGRAAALLHETQLTKQPPFSTAGPIAVIRWKGVDYLLDGRKRINHWQRNSELGPFDVIVIGCRDDI
jgi:hypothetical protein